MGDVRIVPSRIFNLKAARSRPGHWFDRAGLKALIMLHEYLNPLSVERLNTEDIIMISNILDLNATRVSSIMTPLPKSFTLSVETFLDDVALYDILTSGQDNIPVHLEDHATRFIGVLPVKSLVTLRSRDEIKIGKLFLEDLPAVPHDMSCQDIVQVFRNRSIQMVLVVGRGSTDGEPLGTITARDIMDELIRK